MAAIDLDSAREAARRLVTRFVFNAVQSGASEAQIFFDGQQITTSYHLNGEWRRQEDMPAAIWPQILRRVRNMAFLTLGPQPPRQEGVSQLVILDRKKGEERHYELGLVIEHTESQDDIRIYIPDPISRPYKKTAGYEFVCGEKCDISNGF